MKKKAAIFFLLISGFSLTVSAQVNQQAPPTLTKLSAIKFNKESNWGQQNKNDFLLQRPETTDNPNLSEFNPKAIKAENFSSFSLELSGGTHDTTLSYNDNTLHPLNWQTLTISAIGIGYGALAFHDNAIRNLNISTRSEIVTDYPHFHTSIDNYLQFSPAAAVIGLNAFGVHGLHPFKDQLCVYAVSSVFLFGIVQGTKRWTHELRPDYSSHNSFPSGHTATAFAAAEWLRVEYWHQSPWIGIAGYAAATATGVLRVYNNRHWVSDVVSGAAIGFLCTRIAYEFNPWIEKLIFHKRDNSSSLESSF